MHKEECICNVTGLSSSHAINQNYLGLKNNKLIKTLKKSFPYIYIYIYIRSSCLSLLIIPYNPNFPSYVRSLISSPISSTPIDFVKKLTADQ